MLVQVDFVNRLLYCSLIYRNVVNGYLCRTWKWWTRCFEIDSMVLMNIIRACFYPLPSFLFVIWFVLLLSEWWGGLHCCRNCGSRGEFDLQDANFAGTTHNNSQQIGCICSIWVNLCTSMWTIILVSGWYDWPGKWLHLWSVA